MISDLRTGNEEVIMLPRYFIAGSRLDGGDNPIESDEATYADSGSGCGHRGCLDDISGDGSRYRCSNGCDLGGGFDGDSTVDSEIGYRRRAKIATAPLPEAI
ncbi:hypothetical protein LSAT2_002760 [Lamellibrachia satsuma]|nr:hypothetical protein LSAT2_002760 [Lamellibrachia satsuma]